MIRMQECCIVVMERVGFVGGNLENFLKQKRTIWKYLSAMGIGGDLKISKFQQYFRIGLVKIA